MRTKPPRGGITDEQADGEDAQSEEGVEEESDSDCDTKWYNTADTVFVIDTYAELMGFAAIVNGTAEGIEQDTFAGKTVKLGADIDLTGKAWTPIGTSVYDKTPTTEGVKMFAGDFDGQGYTITGLSSNGYKPEASETKSTEYCFGLFGYVYGSNISNVNLANVDINCGTRANSEGTNVAGAGVAALIGYYVPADEKVSLISNCHVRGGSVKATNNMGGLIGMFDSQLSQPFVNFTVSDCSNSATVIAEARDAGGILGLINGSRSGNYFVVMSGTIAFKDCVNSGDVTTLGGGSTCAGGILGRDNAAFTGQRLKVVFDGCANKGVVTAHTSGETHVAGLGTAFYSHGSWLVVRDSHNYGSVVATSAASSIKEPVYAGGLIAYAGVADLENNTSVASDGKVTVGGEVKTNNAHIGDIQSILFLNEDDVDVDITGNTYYLNGGTSPEYAALVDDAPNGGNFHLVETAYKDGVEFAGWYGNPEFTGEAYTALSESVDTYYAKWSSDTAPTEYVAKVGNTKYKSFENALKAANRIGGTTLTLLQPVVLTEDATLNFGDTVVKAAEDINPAFRITNGANVTIKGGDFKLDGYAYILGAKDGSSAGNLVIESGSYSCQTTVASVTKGNLTVEGGEFSVKPYEGSYAYLLNCIDANYKDGSASIVVKGGTFYKFNPANNAAEGAETDFVADDFISEEKKTDYWTVRPLNYIAQVGDVKYESLKEAIDSCTNGETVKLIADVTYDADDVVSAHGGATGFGKYDKYNPSIVYIGGTKGATEAENQPSNVNAVLDLNGHTITNNADAYMFLIMDNAKLTIMDSGNGAGITSNANLPIVWATGAETLVTIDSGIYTTANAEGLMWSTHSGDLVVNGGTFKTTADDASLLFMLNQEKYNNPNYFLQGVATLTVNGGDFYGFDPEKVNDDSTQPFTVVNAVSEGYTSIETDNIYSVVKSDAVVAKIGDKKFMTFAAALEAAVDGDTITLLVDCDENVTIKQVKDVDIVIDGNDKTYKGTITIDGSKRSSGAETLTIKNMNFVAEGQWQSSVFAVKNTYVHNLTVDGCSFAGTDTKQAYGILLHHSYNIVVKNTEGTNLYDLVYAQTAVTGLSAENVTVTDSGMGFMLPYGKNLSFKNVDLDVSGVGVGIYNYNASSAVFEDCAIKGSTPVWLEQKNATNAYSLTFNGANALTATEGDALVAMVGTDARFKVVLNDEGIDANKVQAAARIGSVCYNSLEYAMSEAVDGDTVVLLADQEVADTVVLDKKITLDLNGKKVSAAASLDSKPVFRVLADVTVDGATIEGGTVDGTPGTSSYAFIVGNAETAGKLTIDGGTYKGDTSAVSVTKGEAVISGGYFEATEYEGTHEFTLNCIDANYNDGTAKISVTGGTFYKFNPEDNAAEGANTNFVAQDYMATESGDNYVVSEWNYEIWDWDDLIRLDKIVESGNTLEGKTVKLMANIDLYKAGENGEPVTFNPIGANNKYFKGTFDGRGHTISNMYQSGWALGYDWDNYGTIGLFSYLWNATVKNLTIEDAECFVEGGCVGGIAGSAWGDCTFENIAIVGSKLATYNNRAGGIVGYTGGTGTFTFKDIRVESDTVIAGLWGSFDSSLGGVMGQLQESSKAVFDNVEVRCRIDAYNDVTASYKYYAYRMCGMLIGRVPVDANNKPILTNVTINEKEGLDYGVEVAFGDWANYTYLWDDSLSRGCQRVQSGYAYDGIDVAQYPEADITLLPFTSLFGGQQYGSYGIGEYDRVLVTFPEEAAIGETKYWSLGDALEAAEDGDTVTLLKDVNIYDEIVVDGKEVTIDLNGKTASAVRINPVIRVKGDADVTVKGGSIVNKGGYAFILGSAATDTAEATNGYLTIESGSYTGQTTVASVTKGELSINGGEFKTAEGDYGSTYLLNCIDANYKDGSASIVVKGGTYHAFDPANNAAEGEGTDFVAEGYVSETADEGATYTVREANYVAQIGTVKYESLEEAIAAVDAVDDVVVLLKNVVLSETVETSQSFTLDLGANTVTAKDSLKKMFRFSGTTVVKNGTIQNDNSNGRCIETRAGDLGLTLQGVKLIAANGASQPLTIGGSGTDITVAIEDSTIKAGTGYGIVTFNPVNMTIDNSKVYGYAALYAKGVNDSEGSADSVINVTNGSLLAGVNNNADNGSNNFATIVVEDEDVAIYVKGSDITASATGTAAEALFALQNADEVKVMVDENSTLTTNSHYLFNWNETQTVVVPSDYKAGFVADGYDLVSHEGIELPGEFQSGTSLVAEAKYDYVAVNVQTGVGYTTAQAGIDAAEQDQVVKMVKDSNEPMVIVNAGVTLDLNGKYLTAKNFLSFGDVIDKAEVAGGLVISNDTAKAFTQLQADNGADQVSDSSLYAGYMPLYDTENGCYRFYQYQSKNRGTYSPGSMKAAAGFAVWFDKADAYELMAQGGTGISVVANIKWTGCNGFFAYTFSEGTLQNYASTAATQFASGKIKVAMTLTMSGFDEKAVDGTLVSYPVVESVTGVAAAGKEFTFSYSSLKE